MLLNYSRLCPLKILFDFCFKSDATDLRVTVFLCQLVTLLGTFLVLQIKVYRTNQKT